MAVQQPPLRRQRRQQPDSFPFSVLGVDQAQQADSIPFSVLDAGEAQHPPLPPPQQQQQEQQQKQRQHQHQQQDSILSPVLEDAGQALCPDAADLPAGAVAAIQAAERDPEEQAVNELQHGGKRARVPSAKANDLARDAEQRAKRQATADLREKRTFSRWTEEEVRQSVV